jgi:hypothetical protein
MLRLHSENPQLAPRALVDFLCHPSVTPYLYKMMKGANCLFSGQAETLFQNLIRIPGAKQRISSHAHQAGTSYGIETPLFGELLFWKDLQGNLRIQFEAHALNNIFKIYYHFVDYLNYRLNGLQQGLYGSSKYTDAHPLCIRI